MTEIDNKSTVAFESSAHVGDNGIEDPSDFEVYLIDEMAKAEASEHFWFISRLALIEDVLHRYVKFGSSLLDIGAGTGYVASYIQSLGYKTSVGDISQKGLEFAVKAGIDSCYLMDIYKPPFKNKFDAISLFDVIEHLDKDQLALDNVGVMLNRGGKVLITVPAHEWLWNKHDELAGHKRRYTMKSLREKVELSGLKVVYNSYIFRSLVPFLWIRSLLGNKLYSSSKASSNGLFVINPAINKILTWLCVIERRLGKLLPNIAGGSILLVAEK